MTEIPSFSGKRLFWVWLEEDREAYNVNSVFFGKGLREAHGQASLHFDEGSISVDAGLKGKEGVRSIEPSDIFSSSRSHLELLPELVDALRKEEIPQEEWGNAIFPEKLFEGLSTGSVNQMFMTIVASVSQSSSKRRHFRHEEKIRLSNSNLSDRASATEYSGPLFGYAIDKRSDGNEDETLLERRAPINVAWNSDIGLSAVNVSTQMEQNGWGGQYNVSPEKRHVIINQQSSLFLSNLDDDAGKMAGPPLEQWHCRLYNIPDTMDQNHSVAGQAHRDPKDHNKIQKYFRNVNWYFQDSRTEVGGDWSSWNFSQTTDYIGNEDNFGSSNGELDQISN